MQIDIRYVVEQHNYGQGHALHFDTMEQARAYAIKLGDNFKVIRKDTYTSEYVK